MMRKCKYCGKSTGLFSSYHKECQSKHHLGMEKIKTYLRELVQKSSWDLDKVKEALHEFHTNNYLTADEIKETAISVLKNSKLAELSPVDFLQNIGKFKALTEIPKKLISDKILSVLQAKIEIACDKYFVGKAGIEDIKRLTDPLVKIFGSIDPAIEDVLLTKLNAAATGYLMRENMTDEESKLFFGFKNAFGISIRKLPSKWADSNIVTVHQYITLINILDGKTPDLTINAPVMLGDKEYIAWAYTNISLKESNIEGNAATSGCENIDIRQCKEQYRYKESFKDIKVDTAPFAFKGKGILVLTNKNLIFQTSDNKSTKIPYKDITTVNPFSDGLAVNRNGKPTAILCGFDPWFIVSLFAVIDVK